MALTEARREGLLAYCRIDLPSEQDLRLLEILYFAAVGYMGSAGVSTPPPGTPRAAQYDLCVNAMVLDWWDKREMTVPEGRSAMDNPALRRVLDQLKLTEGPDGGVSDG